MTVMAWIASNTQKYSMDRFKYSKMDSFKYSKILQVVVLFNVIVDVACVLPDTVIFS